MPTASRGRQKGGLVAAPTVRGAGRLGLLARHVAATPPAAAAVPSDAPPPPPDVGLDADVFLANRLTALEREQFARDGFFVLEDAIPEAHSAQMRDVLTQIREEKVAAGTLGANEQAKQGAFSQANTLQTQEPVLALLSNEKVFAKVVDILGPNVFCYSTTRKVPTALRTTRSGIMAVTFPLARKYRLPNDFRLHHAAHHARLTTHTSPLAFNRE